MKKYLSIFILICITICIHAQSLSDEIKTALKPFVDSKELSGMVTIVAKPTNIISIDCIGYQDMDSGKKMSPDALFWIASQSKPITAAAVMMLVDEGVLDLDKPINIYLPELGALMARRVKQDKWEVLEQSTIPITLRHLLSHTSGIPFLANLQEKIDKLDVLPLSLSIYATATTPLLFEPGEGYRYSNQGINIAASIVERVSNMPFEDFLQQRLFKPLGIKSATFWPTEELLKNLVKPYMMDENKGLVETHIDQLQYPLNNKHKRFAEAGGGLFCSPVDLVKFYQMIANKGVFNGKRYLSENAIMEMGKKQTGNKVAVMYGLGFDIGEEFMGHGGAYGTNSQIKTKRDNLIVMYFAQQKDLPKHKIAMQTFWDIVNKQQF
jgi:CubicO group peptidase (beta-lactamase class C family)